MKNKFIEDEKVIFEKLHALYIEELKVFFKKHEEELTVGTILNAMSNLLTNMSHVMYSYIGHVLKPSLLVDAEINYSVLSRAILKKLKKKFEAENEKIRIKGKH